MSDPIITGLFRALVARVGGVDAASAFLAARWGAASKGHVSKMCAGSVGVTIEAVLALEDGIGERPVTDYLHLRGTGGDLPLTEGGAVQMVTHLALAAAQAQMALARALDQAGPGGSRITADELQDIGAAAHQMRAMADQMAAAVEAAQPMARADQTLAVLAARSRRIGA